MSTTARLRGHSSIALELTPPMADKDIESLVRSLARAGWRVAKTSKNYYLVHAPDGTFVVRIPSTPSSPRTIRRIRGILRRHGFEE